MTRGIVMHRKRPNPTVLWLGIALASCGLFALTGCPAGVPGGDVQQQPQDDQTPVKDNSAVEIAREIEEADIVKILDGYFYLANPYKGLRIIDARSPGQAVLSGGLALGGRGVELFVRGDLAFILTSADFFNCAGEPIGSTEEDFAGVAAPDFEGSRLWVVDVSNKSAPSLVTQLDFSGFVSATRRVGDVIYAAGNVRREGDSTAQQAEDEVFVRSINIADPSNIIGVDSETFSGVSLDIHVSDTAMYVFGPDPDLLDTTLVTYVDISDPGGEVVPRGRFRVPGTIKNRFFVDEYQGVFRIVTEQFVESTFALTVRLFTYDVSDPDAIVRMADLQIVANETLEAVRFDGQRGYAVTFLQIDPLFVLDLSDPSAPSVAGELEVPGFSTHIVPLGDRLVAVGFDDTEGFRPAVALYDVSDPTQPSQLSRIIVGEAFSFGTTSEATVDEKALRVIEDAGLILLPFSTFDFETGTVTDSLQIIGLGADSLSERGTVAHRGLVRRAGLIQQSIWVLSDLSFQTVNVDDLDSPTELATVEIIGDQELLDAGLADCADTAHRRGTVVGDFFVGPDFFFGPDPSPFFPGLLCPLLGGVFFAGGVAGLIRARK